MMSLRLHAYEHYAFTSSKDGLESHMLTCLGSGVCACMHVSINDGPQAYMFTVCRATSADQFFLFDKSFIVHPTIYSGHWLSS